MEKVLNNDYSYPIGRLVPDDNIHKPINIYFQHYKSYEEARDKWKKRCERINFSNIYYIWEFYDTLFNVNDLQEFDALPIKKLIITHKLIEGIKNAYQVSCYTNDKPIGQILKYNGITGMRYLDEIDYVSFLNS